MSAKRLLSSSNYLQYPKFLALYIGINETLLLSELCDKDSYYEDNMDNYDGWFYLIRDVIEEDTGLTDRQQRKAIESLTDLGIIQTKRVGIPSKLYYHVKEKRLEFTLEVALDSYKQRKLQRLQKVTSRSNETEPQMLQNVTSIGDETDNHTIIKTEEKITETNNAPAEPAPVLSPSKTRRRFREEIKTLQDDLESNKEIKREVEKKKKTQIELCLDEINEAKYNFSEETKKLLREYIQWAHSGTDERRIKTNKLWKRKLEALVTIARKTGQPMPNIIQQSIDEKWYKFVEVQSNDKKNSRPVHDDGVISKQADPSTIRYDMPF